MTQLPGNRGDLDYLKGLADRRAEVLVEGLPGLDARGRATVLGMRRNAAGQAGELTLGLPAGSLLAAIMAGIRERDDRLVGMTIATGDPGVRIELRGLAITRIDDGGESMVLVHLTSTPLGGVTDSTRESSREVPT
jgi:hypothetical protein